MPAERRNDSPGEKQKTNKQRGGLDRVVMVMETVGMVMGTVGMVMVTIAVVTTLSPWQWAITALL